MSLLAFCSVLAAGVLAVYGDPPSAAAKEAKSLFDGKTLDGWEGPEKVWRVEEGAITGGSLTENVPRNEFLATKAEFQNFVLRLKIKLTGTEGFINSGIQIRSQRVPNSSEMKGYQCDFGDPTWWGSIYDESRRNKVLAQSDMTALNKVLKRNDWNEYVIRAEGWRITTWINGVQGVDYVEPDGTIPQKGKIGIQVHGGGKALVQVKDVTIESGSGTPAAESDDSGKSAAVTNSDRSVTATFVGAPEPAKPPKDSPLTPDEQQRCFSLPPGFEIELVAAEDEGLIGKFVTTAWDHSGRLWTMTALDYPVDGNETPDQAKALFANPGKDKVLVFDFETRGSPSEPPRYKKKPQVFADGLAIPLGILPYKNGCIVQHGSDIVFLSDANNDGKADQREVLLTGFGTQDSHLFPHGFTRGPGNWIYLAQGAFNDGVVKAKDGSETRFRYCKMARFTPDGEKFQVVSAGLNNIWGFVISREGEMFAQEANDLGYPVTEWQVGDNFPGIGDDKLKPYAPLRPAPVKDFQMGGTGLSGLALAEDYDTWPEPYGPGAAEVAQASNVRHFYIANPITNRIQAIGGTKVGAHYQFTKLPDFVLCSDPWFRPIHINFGPDGCLYIVDWYNKIISHNEVPRAHPERDKTRGRIWRVKHREQKWREVVDVSLETPYKLLYSFHQPTKWASTATWLEVVDRGTLDTMWRLRQRTEGHFFSEESNVKRALSGLWVLEALQAVDQESLLWVMGRSSSAVRAQLAQVSRRVEDLQEFAADENAHVKVAAFRSLGDMGLIRLIIEHLPAAGGDYDAEFVRYMARSELEKHSKAVAELLDGLTAEDLPSEGRVLATLALDPKASASRLAKLLPHLDRSPNDEELLRLIEFPDEPGVAGAVQSFVSKPAALEALLRLRTRIDAKKLAPLITPIARDLLPTNSELALKLISAFKPSELEPAVAAMLEGKGHGRPARGNESSTIQPKNVQSHGQDARAPLAAALLRTLRELGSMRADLFISLTKSQDPAIREEAIACLAGVPDRLVPLWPELNALQRRKALAQLTGTKQGSRVVVAALKAGTIPQDDLDGPTVEKLQAVLGHADPELAALLDSTAHLFRAVLVLDGHDDSWADSNLTIEGPFTVECWVRLDPGIGNEDGILGAPGVLDMNFYDGRFRVWVGGGFHDVVIAKKPVVANVWTHVAVTRDAAGRFKIFLNGELDQDQSKSDPRKYEQLDIGRTGVPKGTVAALTEFRLWNRERSADEIRATFDRDLSQEAESLVAYFSGNEWGRLHGGARISKTTDFPPLLTISEAQAMDEKFTRFRALAEKPGDPVKGKFVAAVCFGCHKVRGEGGQIGPDLSGAGAMGTEALLRNLLTPNAALEPGYRTYRVELKDGSLREGFLAKEDGEAIILRLPGTEDQRIPQSDIRRAGFTKQSLMPEALLDAFPPEQITDLFAFLKTLK